MRIHIGLSGAATIALLLAAPAWSQASAPRRPAASSPASAPALPSVQLLGHVRGVRSDAGASHALAIEVMDVRVRIIGGIAETTITATFKNEGGEVLEGDFRFDMPRGAVVTGYALDVGQDLIDGVIAPRDQAREAYQRRVAVRVDPGLAEVTWADQFSTRIFPINPRASRTIRLVMTSPVDAREGYVLPMRPSGPVGRFTLHIERDAGQISFPDGLGQRPGENGAAVDVERWRAQLDGTLRISANAPGDAARLNLSRHANGEGFFTLDAPIPVGAAGPDRSAPVHIFWDRSASRIDDDRAAEQALLTQWLAQRRPSSITISLFDSSGVETRRVNGAADLAAVLAAVHYAGGTSFAALPQIVVAPGATCLLFSDGRVSIDARANFSLPCRTHAIASDREVDRGWLSAVTGASGGAFVDLRSVRAEAAIALLDGGDAAIGALYDDAGNRIDALRLPAAPGRFRLVGPMPRTGGLTLVAPDGRRTPFQRPMGEGAVFSGAGAIWASRRLAADAADMPIDQMVAWARRYGVASPMASFIVLENPGDYVEANIPPPATYPKALADQYAQMRANADRQIASLQAQRLGQVEGMWRERIGWWETRFPVETTPQRPLPRDNRRDGRNDDRRNRAESVNEGPVPPPPPAPPPPPPPPPVMAAPTEDIVLTASRVAGGAVNAEAAEMASNQPASSATEGYAADDGIRLPTWSSDRIWIARLSNAADWQAEQDVLAREYGALPIFWFDVAEWHFRAGRVAEARRAVESALDLPARDNETLAIVANRLTRYGDVDRAIFLLRQLAMRENERPQPLYTLGVTLMARAEAHRSAGRRDAARADLTEALASIADAVLKVRRENYAGFETVALMDANRALAQLRALGGDSRVLPASLIRNLDLDLRVVVEWNTPRTDLDLWVTAADGERVGYSNRQGRRGGHLTADVTNGFGPEEFVLRRADNGSYQIQANSFAPDRTNPNGPSTLSARIIRNFGRPNQSEERIDVEMQPDRANWSPIATVEMGKTGG